MPLYLTIAIAVLLIGLGAGYPLVAIVLLVRRLNQPDHPAPLPMEITLRLLLVATVPLAGVLGGFALLRPDVWQSVVLRTLIWGTAIPSLLGGATLLLLGARSRTRGNK